MVLNNYYEWVRICNSTQLEYANTDILTNMKNFSGNNIYMAKGGNASYLVNGYAKNYSLANFIVGWAGSSDAEGNVYDYDLKSRIASGLAISINITITADAKTSRICTLTITNNTQESKTIKEVGIGKTFYTRASDPSVLDSVLFCRAVLDEAVEISAGASATVTVKWDEE